MTKKQYRANGPAIVSRLEQLDISKQSAFVEDAGISERTLQRYKNSGAANLRELKKLALAFGCEWQDIGFEVEVLPEQENGIASGGTQSNEQETDNGEVLGESYKNSGFEYQDARMEAENLPEATKPDSPTENIEPIIEHPPISHEYSVFHHSQAERGNDVRTTYAQRYKWLAISFCLLVVTGLGFYSIYWLEITRPVELAWKDGVNGMAEPYVICGINTDETVQLAGIVIDSRGKNIVPTGKRLAWRVRLGDTSEQNHWFYHLAHSLGYKGLYVTLVMIGQKSGIKTNDFSIVLPSNADNSRIPPGRIWTYSWSLDDMEESMLFVIMANRRQESSIAELKKDLQQSFGENGETINLPGLEEYLNKHANGSLHFMFTTQAGAPNCEN